MTDPAFAIARKAARTIARRDKVVAELRKLDAALQEHSSAYSQATRTWGFTPLMLRQACEARGLLERQS